MDATDKAKFATVEEYFAAQSPEKRKLLLAIRKTIKKEAPEAEEVVSYNMPAFKQQGMLVWYAAFKEHIGFFPTPGAIIAFKKDLSAYKCSKGAIQFPSDKPMPLTLVSKIVQYRLKENAAKAAAKAG